MYIDFKIGLENFYTIKIPWEDWTLFSWKYLQIIL